MISCPLSMNLQNFSAFLLFKTCMFELKPILFLYSYQKIGHTVYLSFKNNFMLNLYNEINYFLTSCPVRHVPYSILLVCFFFSHQKKVIVNKVISFLKQCLQLASVHGSFSCIQHLYIQRKTTKKFNFKLLCLYHIPYDIQLIIYFKESRKVKTLFSIMTNLDQY